MESEENIKNTDNKRPPTPEEKAKKGYKELKETDDLEGMSIEELKKLHGKLKEEKK